ncbi:biopolymer transporter ExbD [bacterium]|nr:biopolymer transporter ExbD [bacterium]
MRGRGNYLTAPSQGFPVIPMIDVIFNLLLFFMLISRNLPPALSVALPEADAATPTDNPPSIAISINTAGDLMLDGELTQWEDLGPLLQSIAAAPEGGSTQVRIAADKDVGYDYVVRALDAAAQAGLTQVALETSPSVPAGAQSSPQDTQPAADEAAAAGSAGSP